MNPTSETSLCLSTTQDCIHIKSVPKLMSTEAHTGPVPQNPSGFHQSVPVSCSSVTRT